MLMGFFGRHGKNCARPKVLHASGKFLLPSKCLSLIIRICLFLILFTSVLLYTDAVWDLSLVGSCSPKVHDIFVAVMKFWPWDIPSDFTEGKQQCQPSNRKGRKMRHVTASFKKLWKVFFWGEGSGAPYP